METFSQDKIEQLVAEAKPFFIWTYSTLERMGKGIFTTGCGSNSPLEKGGFKRCILD